MRGAREDIGVPKLSVSFSTHTVTVRESPGFLRRSSNAGALACMRKAISNDSIMPSIFWSVFKIVQKALIHRLDKIDLAPLHPWTDSRVLQVANLGFLRVAASRSECLDKWRGEMRY